MSDSSGTSTSSGFDGAKLITGGLALVSTITGLVGAFTGVVPRLLRNHPGYFILALVFVLLAIALGFFASEVTFASVTVVDVTGAAPNTTTTTTEVNVTKRGKKLLRGALSFASLVTFA